MKGFELEINGEKIFGSIEDGVAMIIAEIVDDKVELRFSGSSFNEDKSVKEQIDWFKSELKEGQEFTIRVIEKNG